MMTSDEQTIPGLVPMTYDEAVELYRAIRREFSFVVAPYMIRKTVMMMGRIGNRGTDHIVAAPPTAYFPPRSL